MSGVTDFEPIGVNGYKFKGTFDGNGYAISNLTTDTNTSGGLFGSAYNATIRNVNLVNVDITGTGSSGGLAGWADKCTITNCSATGSVYCNGGYFAGGLIGSADEATITQCYANVTVTHRNTTHADDSSGGFIGNINGDTITNCMSEGSVSGTKRVGGFVGNSSQGINHILSIIDNCYSTTDPSSVASGAVGSFFGANLRNETVTNCKSTKTTASLHFVGTGHAITEGTSTVTSNPTNFSSHSASTTDAIEISELGKPYEINQKTIPSIASDGSGGMYSNILAALNKAGVYDSHTNSPSDIPGKVKTFLLSFSDDNTGNSRLWHLNQALVTYLNSSEVTNAFTTALASDINSTTSSATNSYQNIGTEYDSIRQTNNSSWTPTYHAGTAGTLNIPNIETIKSEVIASFNKAGFTTTEAQINSFFNRYSTSDNTDLAYLANINDIVNNYVSTNSTTQLTDLKNIIEGGTSKMEVLPSYIDAPSHYTITMNPTPQDINIHYVQVEVEDPTNVIGEYWDTSKAIIAQAMSMWKLLQRGIEIVDEPLASSTEYLKNLLETGEAVLTSYKLENFATYSSLSATEIEHMSDSDFDELMGIINTSVAVNTSVREVADETNLRKAEAKYEADMRKIDHKDRRYDTELAALDAERNAIKSEMETLKTVAKDNVERTFKLFS